MLCGKHPAGTKELQSYKNPANESQNVKYHVLRARYEITLSTVFCVSYERCASTSVLTLPGTIFSSSRPTFTDSTSAMRA